MNTNSHAAMSRFSALRSLGRGLAVGAAVAVFGVAGMSTADAEAAGVATGVEYVATPATAPTTSSVTPARADYSLRDDLVAGGK